MEADVTLLFVGEERSATAIRRDWRWEDGRLAAKQLFDALQTIGIDPRACRFANIVDVGVVAMLHDHMAEEEHFIVAMGRKAQAFMQVRGIPHIAIVHPAARGAIRGKERYAAHLRDAICGACAHVAHLANGRVGLPPDRLSGQHRKRRARIRPPRVGGLP